MKGQMVPKSKLTEVTDATVMDCDCCGVPMTFEEYSTHPCPGLGGKNPFLEKLEKAEFKMPGSGESVEGLKAALSGSLSARGSIRPQGVFVRVRDWIRRKLNT